MLVYILHIGCIIILRIKLRMYIFYDVWYYSKSDYRFYVSDVLLYYLSSYVYICLCHTVLYHKREQVRSRQVVYYYTMYQVTYVCVYDILYRNNGGYMIYLSNVPLYYLSIYVCIFVRYMVLWRKKANILYVSDALLYHVSRYVYMYVLYMVLYTF